MDLWQPHQGHGAFPSNMNLRTAFETGRNAPPSIFVLSIMDDALLKNFGQNWCSRHAFPGSAIVNLCWKMNQYVGFTSSRVIWKSCRIRKNGRPQSCSFIDHFPYFVCYFPRRKRRGRQFRWDSGLWTLLLFTVHHFHAMGAALH